jgi:hypothetical protein
MNISNTLIWNILKHYIGFHFEDNSTEDWSAVYICHEGVSVYEMQGAILELKNAISDCRYFEKDL